MAERRLRRATPADLPRVRDLVERAYARYVSRIGRRPGPMDDDYAARLAAGQLQLLEVGGTPVGLLVLEPQNDALLLDNIAVDPGVQGRGHGGYLLAAAERAAREQGFSRLRLYTHLRMVEAQALYRRAGWVEVARRRERGFDRIYFEKPV